MMQMLVQAIAMARGPRWSPVRTRYLIIIALACRRGFKSIKRLQ